jgi:hypothetical protein
LSSVSCRPERISRRAHLGGPQPPHDLEALHVRQPQIEHDDIKVVMLGEIDGVFASLGRLADDALTLESRIDQLCRDGIVFNNQSSHHPLLRARS